ncbi:hypothetical protein TNCV_1605761 [Trichonephila clavipes]|nr:hypothetical protein TNCV_1605761 [Trichonephila clavipes]
MSSFKIIATIDIRSKVNYAFQNTTVTKPSTSTQAHLLPFITSIALTTSTESSSIPLIGTTSSTSNSLCSSVASSSSKHFLHPQYQCFHLYQLKQVLFLKLLPLHPILYLQHLRLQNKRQKLAGKNVLTELLPHTHSFHQT